MSNDKPTLARLPQFSDEMHTVIERILSQPLPKGANRVISLRQSISDYGESSLIEINFYPHRVAFKIDMSDTGYNIFLGKMRLGGGYRASTEEQWITMSSNLPLNEIPDEVQRLLTLIYDDLQRTHELRSVLGE